MAHEQASPSSLARSAANKRGSSCLICRRRKIKCDGEKPACGQCGRSSQADDCEYDDSGPSKTRILEETIAKLEARISELEKQRESEPQVALIAESDSPTSSRAYSTSPFWAIHTPPCPTSPPFSLAGPSPQFSANLAFSNEEPPIFVVSDLLPEFLYHASEVQFFLNPVRFQDAILLPLPFGHPDRPSPALLSTIFLWEAHLSQSDFAAYEHTFLDQAVRYITAIPTSDHPRKVLHGIQAYVLLCVYFFRKGRILDGKHYLSLAVSYAFQHGLHKAHSPVNPLIFDDDDDENVLPGSLPQAKDAIEEGERIDAFWAVFALNNYWSGSLLFPSNISYIDLAHSIDAPWPLPRTDYELGALPISQTMTVKRFLQNELDTALSYAAIFAKASLLYERASHLFGVSIKMTGPQYSSITSPAFASLDQLIIRVRDQLPCIEQTKAWVPAKEISTVAASHTLLNAAAIQLHRQFTNVHTSSREVCISAAMAIVQWTELVLAMEMRHLNPIMSSLWKTACHALIDEIWLLRADNVPVELNPLPVSGHAVSVHVLRDMLQQGVYAMAKFARICPLTKFQLLKIQEALALL